MCCGEAVFLDIRQTPAWNKKSAFDFLGLLFLFCCSQTGFPSQLFPPRAPPRAFMSNGSPTAYLLWAILSCIFLGFLFLHLWSYDRFKCLKWDSGRQPGAFKRVMTYSYLTTVPMLVVFGVVMTAIKFKEGFIVTPSERIIPRPFELWDQSNRRWILPLYFILSIAWSLELVTHLEELTFWLFLLHQGPSKREWFYSWEFRTWYIGSMLAVLGMPLTALITRKDLDMCEAWVFLVGSSASTSTTLFFLYVLARFPGFIRHVKSEGAEPDVVVRLATFYQLNLIRVVFRFLFTLPLFVISLDGIQGSHPILRDPFWSDFLLMIGGIGCFVSSAITLLIFFPRSITSESGYKARITSPQMSAKSPVVTSPLPHYTRHLSSPKSPTSFNISHHPQSPRGSTQLAAFHYSISNSNPHNPSPPPSPPPHAQYDDDRSSFFADADGESNPEYESDAESIVVPGDRTPMASPVSGVRSEDTVWERQGSEHQMNDVPRRSSYVYNRHGKMLVSIPIHGTISSALEGGGAHPSPSHLHPYVMNFTSPIDLLDVPDDELPRAL